MKKTLITSLIALSAVSCGSVATAETHLEVNNVGIDSANAGGAHYDFQQCKITAPNGNQFQGNRIACDKTSFSLMFQELSCSTIVSVYAGINGISVSATNVGCTSDIDAGQGLGYIGFIPYPKAYYTTFDGWTSMGVSK